MTAKGKKRPRVTLTTAQERLIEDGWDSSRGGRGRLDGDAGGEVTRDEAAALRAAVAWWTSRRPCRWTVDDHLATPAINAHETARTAQLARAVGRLVQRRRQHRKTALGAK